MKKRTLIAILCVAMLSWNVSAFAEDLSVTAGVKDWLAGFSEDLTVTAGLKGWLTDWDGFLGFTGEEARGDTSLLVGPSVKLSYGKFFGGITYLTTTSDFEDDWVTMGEHVDYGVDRKDIDVVLGFMAHPRFGVYVGYKRISSEGDFEGTVVSDPSQFAEGEFEEEIQGFAVGAAFNYPLERMPLVLVASCTFMPSMDSEMGRKETSSSYADDVTFDGYWHSHNDGYSIEFGATYNLREHIGLSLGYKYQEIMRELCLSDSADMEFSGITLSADYRF